MILPDTDRGKLALAAVLGAFQAGGGMDPLQASVLGTFARDLYGIESAEDLPPPLPATTFLATDPDRELRRGPSP